MNGELYEALARVFGFPEPSFDADVTRAAALCADHPKAAQALREFERLLPKADPIALRELHTRTFDVQPITSLDIGYTLFGEDYKRGALLAKLSAEHTRAKNDCGLELADHLTNVLRLLPRLDQKSCDEFVKVLLGPAVQEMINEFEPSRMAKKEALYKKHHKTVLDTAEGEQRTAYRHALVALRLVLQRDFSLPEPMPFAEDSKFAASVDAELRVEDDHARSERT
ncbi:MAG: hypothetical protein AMXMBFR34_32380 [Myxococcaceae bacterium]